MNGWHLADLLPGLYVALLAWLLGRVLRRWFDPLPARIAAIFGLVLLVLLGTVLLGGQILLPVEILTRMAPWRILRPAEPALANRLQLDLVSQITPALALVRRAVRAGEWPLWNALAGFGMPLLADPQSQPFQPLVALAWPLPLAQAAGATAALRVWVALVFGFLFFRRQGVGELPALAGSLVFGLGGFLQLWLGWPIANSAALLPLLLYAVALTDDRGARRDFFLLAVAIGAVLLAGQPETAVNDLLLAGLFALARLRSAGPDRPSRPSRPSLRYRLGGWLLAGLLAAAVTAPLLLPAADYLPLTHRNTRMENRNRSVLQQPILSGWRTAAERRDGLLRIEKRMLSLAAPNAFGNNCFGPYWGYDNINEDGGGFAGSAALLAALLACWPLRPPFRRFPQERLCLGLALLCLLVVARPPGTIQLVAALPLLGKSATYQHRLVLPLLLALAYLTACTLERWSQGGVRRRPLAVAALGLLAVVGWAYLGPGVPQDRSQLALLRHSWLAAQLVAIAAAAFLLAAPPGHDPGHSRAWSRWRGGLFVFFLAAELLFFHSPANPGQLRRFYWPTTPAVAFLEHHLEPRDGYRMTALGWSLQPNGAALYGLADGRYTNPLQPWNAAVVLVPLVDSLDQVNDLYYPLEHPLYSLLSVRYVLVPENAALPPPWRLAFADPSAWVYERPDPLPRLFFPTAAERLPGYPWPRWMARRAEFASTVLLRDRPGLPARWQAAPEPAAAASRVEIRQLTAAHLEGAAHLAQPRLLAASQYQDGGWHLLLDRQPHSTVVADGPLLAAWLPAGEHRLDLLYRPRTFLPACLLAALGLALGALWWVPRPELRPRSPRT
ncbi:MAG TPA: hypothetical protein VMM92_04540 [Thermoanaerobaculia bacterium]|nr:hypothetical protein [Thermoanaerobaculia bacterium]